MWVILLIFWCDDLIFICDNI